MIFQIISKFSCSLTIFFLFNGNRLGGEILISFTNEISIKKILCQSCWKLCSFKDQDSRKSKRFFHRQSGNVGSTSERKKFDGELISPYTLLVSPTNLLFAKPEKETNNRSIETMQNPHRIDRNFLWNKRLKKSRKRNSMNWFRCSRKSVNGLN